MKQRILWIEDGARVELPEWAAPVYASGKYALHLALNASMAVTMMADGAYDGVVVDIRLPPGDSPEWVRLFQDARQSRERARLGLEVLRTILGDPAARVKLPTRARWATADRFGVLTVESRDEVEDTLAALGVRFYRQKEYRLSPSILLEVIEDICRRGR